MTEKISKVSNPLTVIAIFAGIAEVAGTVTLPFVNDTLQSIFIWYVMCMPVLIVFLFFGILIFKREILYAPSDFREDESFLKTWKIRHDLIQLKAEVEGIPEDERLEQFKEIISKLESLNEKQLMIFTENKASVKLKHSDTKFLELRVFDIIANNGFITKDGIMRELKGEGMTEGMVGTILAFLLEKEEIIKKIQGRRVFFGLKDQK